MVRRQGAALVVAVIVITARLASAAPCAFDFPTAPSTLALAPVATFAGHFSESVKHMEHVSADVNHDGYPDYFVDTRNIHVLLSDGAPDAFTAAPLYTTSVSQAVDVDLDGNIDLVASGVRIHYSSGGTNPTFATLLSTQSDLGSPALVGVVVDLDAAFALDIVGYHASGTGIYIYLATGARSYAPAASLVPGMPTTVTANDVVWDAANERLIFLAPNEMWVLTQTLAAAPFFEFAQRVTGTGSYDHLHLGHVNGDGVADVLMIDRGFVSGKQLVGFVYMLSDADTKLLAPGVTTVLTNTLARTITFADFNGDGLVDHLRSREVGSNTVIYLALGDAAGSFAPLPSANYELDPSADAACLALMVGVSNTTHASLVCLSLDETPSPPSPPEFSVRVATHAFAVDKVAVASVTAPTAFSTSFNAGLRITDVSGDGVNDVVFATTVGAYALLGTGQGTVGSTPLLLGSHSATVNGLAVGDFTGDAIADFCISSTLSSVKCWTGIGSGLFAAPISLAGSGSSSRGLDSCDVDLDGRLDLVASEYSSRRVFWYSTAGTDSPASWSKHSIRDASGNGDQVVVCADFTGDGYPDIISSLSGPSSSNGIFTWVNQGTGVAATSFVFSSPSSIAAGARFVAVGDADGDGWLDYAWIDDAAGYVVKIGINNKASPAGAWLGFAPSAATAAAVSGSVILTLGDVDSDGLVDVAVVRYGIHVFRATGVAPASFSATPQSYLTGGTDVFANVAIHDVRNSGSADIVTVGTVSGSPVVTVLGQTAVAPLARVATLTVPLSTTLRQVAAVLASSSPCFPQTLVLAPGTRITGCREVYELVPVAHTWRIVSPTADAVIDCSRTGGLLFEVAAAASLTLEGITVIAPTFSNRPGRSSPILVSGVTGGLSLINVTFSGAHPGSAASGMGAVASLTGESSTLAVANSRFVSNTARDGGGVFSVAASLATATIAASVFESNTVVGSGGGGAISVSAPAATVVIRGSHFGGNVAASGAGGAITLSVAAAATTVNITASVFVGNSAFFGGTFSVSADAPSLLGVAGSTLVSSAAGWGGWAAVTASAAPRPTSFATSSVPVLPASGSALVFEIADATAVGSSSATYGGAFYACGSSVAAAAASFPGTYTASGGGFAFVCVGRASDPVAGASVHAPVPAGASATRWGAGLASPAASLALTPPTAAVSGQPFGSGTIAATDVFNATVADALLVVVVTPAAAADAALVSGLGTGLPLIGPGVASLASIVVSAPLSTFGIGAASRSSAASSSRSIRLLYGVSGAVAVSGNFTVTPQSCPPGFGRSSANTTDSVLVCSACAPGTVSETTSPDPCTAVPPCPDNAVSLGVTTTSVNCVCKDGFTTGGVASGSETTTIVCFPCPQGALCPAGRARPVTAAGYYRTSNTTFIRCLRPSACRGGDVCAPGTGGYMCNTCADGYYTAPSGECAKCPPGGGGLFTLVLVAIVALGGGSAGVLLFTMRATLVPLVRGRKSRSSSSASSLSSSSASSLSSSMSSSFRRGEAPWVRSRNRLPATPSMVLVAVQIVGVIADSRLGWTASADRTLGALNAANLDLDVFATQCSVESYHAKYVFSILIPALVLATAGSVIVIARYVVCKSALADVSARVAFSSVLFRLGPLLYIPIARATLVLFDCTRLPDGSFVLDGDPGVACFDGAWWSVFPVGAAAVGGYVVGFPAFAAWSLFRARDSLRTVATYQVAGSLYKLFRLPFYMTEIARLVLRLLLVVVSLFFSTLPVPQITLMVSLLLVAAIAFVTVEPYHFPLYNGAEFRLAIALVVVLGLGAASFAQKEIDDDDAFLLVGLILALGLLISVAVHAIAADLYQIVQERRARYSSLDHRAHLLATRLRLEAADMGGGLSAKLCALADDLEHHAEPNSPSESFTYLSASTAESSEGVGAAARGSGGSAGGFASSASGSGFASSS